MIAKEVAENLIRAVVGCPNGVQKMSVSMPGLVQTSSNLARVVSDGKTVKLQCLLRSSVNSEKEELGEAISAVFELAGARWNSRVPTTVGNPIWIRRFWPR